MIKQSVLDAFWSQVDKSGDCWLWTGLVDMNGYGCFYKLRGETLAHRVALVIQHGALPKKALACHHCGVRRCVRPEHLYAGTALTNARDLHGPSVLEAQNALSGKRLASATTWLRSRRALGLTQVQMSAAVGFSQAALSKTERGQIIPGADHWVRLARLLGKPIEQIYPFD